MSSPPDIDDAQLAASVAAGDRAALARAITIIESTRDADRLRSGNLLAALWDQRPDNTTRIAFTGPPGAGKSSLIEVVGKQLISQGKRVAVLAIDPSSRQSGGSILGDKTRMPTLSTSKNAFVRPSPTSGTLGGLNDRTRETIVLCEAAGYDTIIVETVGVGQSETEADNAVDYVILVLLAGAGDELQGIKRGILEVADIFAVNKADKDAQAAREARGVYRSASHLLARRFSDWEPPVLLTSALRESGLSDLMSAVTDLNDAAIATGEKQKRRSRQRKVWFDSALRDAVIRRTFSSAQSKREFEVASQRAQRGEACPAQLALAIVFG